MQSILKGGSESCRKYMYMCMQLRCMDRVQLDNIHNYVHIIIPKLCCLLANLR